MYERNLVSALFCYFGVWNLGEAFLDKASTFYTQLKARMLRPYKNRDSFPEITKEGSGTLKGDRMAEFFANRCNTPSSF
jgi:hypothetical protein